jgi:hypothetical protein
MGVNIADVICSVRSPGCDPDDGGAEATTKIHKE